MALTTHPHLVPSLKKEYSYTSTPHLGLYSLLQGEPFTFIHLLTCLTCLPSSSSSLVPIANATDVLQP